jgi:hydrogenase expression/formation protein HypC
MNPPPVVPAMLPEVHLPMQQFKPVKSEYSRPPRAGSPRLPLTQGIWLRRVTKKSGKALLHNRQECRLGIMCLAVPGKITSISGEDPLTRSGKVDFGGILKEVSLAYVPEVKVGDYVIVHVGFALSRVDEEEANQVFGYLREMQELSELEETGPAAKPGP